MGHAQHRQRLADAHVGRPLTRRLIVGNRSARHQVEYPAIRSSAISCSSAATSNDDASAWTVLSIQTEVRRPLGPAAPGSVRQGSSRQVRSPLRSPTHDHRRSPRQPGASRGQGAHRAPEYRLRRVVEKVVASRPTTLSFVADQGLREKRRRGSPDPGLDPAAAQRQGPTRAHLAAASSIASGRPSSRRQTSAIADASPVANSNPVTTASTRSQNNCTDDAPPLPPDRREARDGGGPNASTASSSRRSRRRLVTRTYRSGAIGAAERRRRLPPRQGARHCRGLVPGGRRTPRPQSLLRDRRRTPW